VTCYSFVVPGDPRPKERPRFHEREYTYTPRETQRAEHTVKVVARSAKVKPIQGPVSIELRFFRATKRRCDWDNLAKLVCDALNGIAWKDDSQIVDARIVKGHDAGSPRTEVVVQTHPAPEAVNWLDAVEQEEAATPDTAGKDPEAPA
jgi:Holliday junction resolvase RusA-like endonuclease